MLSKKAKEADIRCIYCKNIMGHGKCSIFRDVSKVYNDEGDPNYSGFTTGGTCWADTQAIED